MAHAKETIVLLQGTAHPELGKEIAGILDVPLGKVRIETFPDGEIGVEIGQSVRGKDVFLLETPARRPNHYLMELLILVDALKRASARSIVVVLSYFAYARQDRRGVKREPITAKLIADLMERAGVTRVLTMDLHTEQIQGFFNVPVDNLYARPCLVEELKKLKLKKPTVVAPDLGSIKIARSFAESLQCDYAVVDKRRVGADKVETKALIGDVEDGEVILVDDMCSTGGTMKSAAEVCKKAGAKAVYAAVTHALFQDGALQGSAIERIFVSNTVPMLPEKLQPRSFLVEVVSVAPLFAKAIEGVVGATSISQLCK